MRTEITKLHKRLQTTFIYVTHDQTEAMTMGTRIVLMKDGVMQQNDTPQNLYDFPENLFVAGFIGTPQMNIFRVKLEKGADGVYAVFGENRVKVPAGKLQRFTSDSYIGREVYMGVRPGKYPRRAGLPRRLADSIIDVSVELVELMGSGDVSLPFHLRQIGQYRRPRRSAFPGPRRRQDPRGAGCQPPALL